MAWFKLDDQSAFHRKVLKAGNEAWGAFCRMGAQSSLEGLDGFVPHETAMQIVGTKDILARLSEANLVHGVEGGYRLHDFLDYNPTAKEVAKLRKVRATAGRSGAAKRWSNGKANG